MKEEKQPETAKVIFYGFGGPMNNQLPTPPCEDDPVIDLLRYRIKT